MRGVDIDSRHGICRELAGKDSVRVDIGQLIGPAFRRGFRGDGVRYGTGIRAGLFRIRDGSVELRCQRGDLPVSILSGLCDGFVLFGIGIALGRYQCCIRLALSSGSGSVYDFGLGLIDGGSPVQAHAGTERDFPRYGIISDRLVSAAERHAAGRIQHKGLFPGPETVDTIDGFLDNASFLVRYRQGEMPHSHARYRSIGILHAGKELRSDKRHGIDLGTVRVPVGDPVQHFTACTRCSLPGLGPCEGERISLTVDNYRDQDRPVIGKVFCAGRNCIGNRMAKVIRHNRRESDGSSDSSETKIRLDALSVHHADD